MYAALGKIKIIANKNDIIADEIDPGFFALQLTAQIPQDYSTFIKAHPEIRTELVAGFFSGKELIKELRFNQTAQQVAEWKQPFGIFIQSNDAPLYLADLLRFSIRSKNYLPTHNSGIIELIGF